jgi:succinyl-CoA synthetase beta subunit
MLTREMENILVSSKKRGWVMEPEAKKIFSLAGLEVPRFVWALTIDSALAFAHEIGYPVVAKIVSPDVVHKSDVGGVIPGITSDAQLKQAFEAFARMPGFAGILVEEMLSGIELIVGAKVDYQFGPVILIGIGGTSVEIYRDTSLRMAPLRPQDAEAMLKGLKAHELLEGYRGSEPVNTQALIRTLLLFSGLVMDMAETIESIDLNPVFCSAKRCTVADARIMLKT